MSFYSLNLIITLDWEEEDEQMMRMKERERERKRSVVKRFAYKNHQLLCIALLPGKMMVSHSIFRGGSYFFSRIVGSEDGNFYFLKKVEEKIKGESL